MKYFMLPDEKESYTIFPNHVLFVSFQTGIMGADGTVFELSFSTEFYPQVVDSTKTNDYPFVLFDSLCLSLDCDTQTICPELETEISPQPARSWCDVHGGVFGPYHSWGFLDIPDKCKRMKVDFVAYLIDPLSGDTLRNRRAEIHLDRIHDKVPAWMK